MPVYLLLQKDNGSPQIFRRISRRIFGGGDGWVGWEIGGGGRGTMLVKVSEL